MIFVTGDTHIPIDISKLSSQKFPIGKELTRDDIVIICGDFGGVWDGSCEEIYWLHWLDTKNFTTYFVDGNHENHTMLNEFPEIELKGGKAHKIKENIYHLKRGQVFTIEEKKFFTMGGASSHDKNSRKEGVSWWAEELPNDDEYAEADINLEKHNWSVDYVISHCVSNRILDRLNENTSGTYETDRLTDYFDVLEDKLDFKHWYFGHYHIDREVDEKHRVLYEDVIQIDLK